MRALSYSHARDLVHSERGGGQSAFRGACMYAYVREGSGGCLHLGVRLELGRRPASADLFQRWRALRFKSLAPVWEGRKFGQV